MTDSLCRICLDGNNKSHSFENMKLQKIYEKLSSSKFNTGDGRPEAVCYICHSQLLRCWKFSEMVCRSENLLNNLIGDKMQITKKNVSSRHHGLRFNLAVSDTCFMTFTDDDDCVREEPNLKGEIVCEIIDCNNVPVKKENTENNKFQEENQYVKEETFIDESMVGETTFTADDNSDNQININNQGPNVCKIDCDSDSRTECNTTLSITDQNTFNCQKCDKKFKKKLSLTLHMRIHTNKPIEKQMSSHGMEYNFICPTCNKAFKTKRYLTKHMSRHLIRTRYNCKECDKTFVKKTSLNNHMRLHTGERLFSCDHCGKQCYSKPLLTEHMGIHGIVKTFVCEICQKSLCTRNSLNTHMKKHTNKKLHTCHDCGKSFMQRCNMVSHMKIHTGEKPYACSSCSKRFCRQDYLKKHMTIHLIVKESFECSICNMKFSRRDSLWKHKQTHIEKSFVYPCSTCDKSFRIKRDMKVHMRTHTDKKIIQCIECHKFFTSQAHLNRHKKFIHNGLKAYACDLCDKRFYRKDNMRSHMAKRHSIE